MKRLVYGFLLLLLPGFIQAQEAAPWPPDPTAIFAPGVKVVSAKETFFPRVIADDENRIVKAFDADTNQWHEFQYPDEATLLSNHIEERNDGTIAFNEPYTDYNAGRADWPKAWLFNPVTGQFSHPEIECDWRIRALPGEGKWVFVYQNDATYLCFTETGEQSNVLPNETIWSNDPPEGNPPQSSPDGKWLALIGYIDDGSSYGVYQVYSYEVSTGKLTSIGQVDGDMFKQDIRVGTWVSNTMGTIERSGGPEIFGSDLYPFDVTRPDSLTFFVNSWPKRLDNPSRYEYLMTTRFLEFKTGSAITPHRPCTLSVYDLFGADTFDLGYDCGEIQRVPNGYVYLGFADAYPIEISTLNYLDRETGNHSEIFNGEIEALDNVSPDGRYAVVLMDRNGQIDSNQYYPEPFDWRKLPDAYLAIVDTQSESFDNVVYETESLVDKPFYNVNNREYQWVNDHTLLMSIGCRGDQLCVRYISLNGRGFTINAVNNVDYPLLLSPDLQHMLTMIPGDTANELGMLSVIDLLDGIVTPIGDANILNTRVSEYRWIDNKTITINLHDENNYDYRKFITYTIRIPQAES